MGPITKNSNVICIYIYLTIILRGRAGYQMIDNQRGAQRRVGYNHLISSPIKKKIQERTGKNEKRDKKGTRIDHD